MNNLILNWKRIRRCLPHGREAANDRAPTLEEIQRLVEYPDRLIKSINEAEAQYLMQFTWATLFIFKTLLSRFNYTNRYRAMLICADVSMFLSTLAYYSKSIISRSCINR